jgi:uncharacterized protein (UPF0332 family)
MSRELVQVARQLILLGDSPLAKISRNKSISAAYYAVFSATCELVADAFSDQKHGGLWGDESFVRAYRAVDHRTIKAVAQLIGGRPEDIAKGENNPKIKKHNDVLANLGLPPERSGGHKIIWSINILALQQARLSADYNPRFQASVQEAQSRVIQAVEALDALSSLGEHGRAQLAFELVFSTRRESQT